MPRASVFIPFVNLSFNSGKINSQGLVQADGVYHDGAGYAPTSPLFAASAAIAAITDVVASPVIGHVNINGANSANFSIYLYAGGKLYRSDVSGDPPWTFTECGTVNALAADEGDFVSFGPNVIFAAGHGNHVQIRRDGQANFEACFQSADKPKAKYVAGIGRRLLFFNIANTGTAGTPDPRRSLAWWGVTDSARQIGNEDSIPEGNTGFNPLDDNFGDGTGLASGKRHATLFKKHGVYSMDLGGELGFTFDRIDTTHGVEQTKSITEMNEDDYAWGNQGPLVVRAGQQVILLGDGFWTERGVALESPPIMDLTVIDAAADPLNNLVFWLVKYQGYDYTYVLDGNNNPTESVGTAATMWALIAYNTVSNQFSFVWRQRSNDGVTLVDEASPGTAHRYIPLCLIDRIPWKNKLPMAGVGILMVESPATNPAGPRQAKLFLTGLSANSYTPQWLVGQSVIFTTGLVPIRYGQLVTIQGIQPVFRSRRGFLPPGVSFKLKTTLDPFSVERQHGPFSTIDGRLGCYPTAGVANCMMVSVEMTIDYRTAGSPVKYAYLLNEIEGVNLILGDGR